MSIAVVDASVLVAFYAADDPRRPKIVGRLALGDTLFAPAHLDVEVVSALRGLARTHPPLERAVPAALRHLEGLPLRRMPLGPLVHRAWELRHNLTAYDATYVALAEALDCDLLTCDHRLASADGPRCGFVLLG